MTFQRLITAQTISGITSLDDTEEGSIPLLYKKYRVFYFK